MRVKVDDKRIINCRADLNQLVPIKYKWAWEKYLAACAPAEISMQRDIEQWHNPRELSADERHMLKRNFGFFFAGGQHCARHLSLDNQPRMPPIPAAAAFEEAVHVHAYQYIAESLARYLLYMEVPCVHDKDAFCLEYINTLTDPSFETGTPEADERLLKSLIAFAMLWKVCFFMSALCKYLRSGGATKCPVAPSRCNIFCAMNRCILISALMLLTPGKPVVMDGAFSERSARDDAQGGGVGISLAEETMPNGVLGLNCTMFKEFLRFANRRGANWQLPASPAAAFANPFPP